MSSAAVRRVGAGDNEYIVVARVSSGAGARELTTDYAIRVRVTDVDEPPSQPTAPMITGETADGLTVEWTEPDNTGPPITGYDVQYREGDSGGFTDARHEGTGRTATLTGLSEATAYQVSVRARNEEGTGPWSEPGEGRTIDPLTVRMTTGLAPPVEGPFTLRFPLLRGGNGLHQGRHCDAAGTSLHRYRKPPGSLHLKLGGISDHGQPDLHHHRDPTDRRGGTQLHTHHLCACEHSDIIPGQQTERGRDSCSSCGAAGGDGADLVAGSDGEPEQRPGDAGMECPGEHRRRSDRPL